MTDKERLEEIKEYFGLWIKNDISRDWSLSSETIDNLKYLIEQAERVQELESEYRVRQTEYLEEHIDRLEKANKRYREAFKQIKLQILFDGAIEDHRKNIIEIIDEALEGEINDSERINKRTREI